MKFLDKHSLSIGKHYNYVLGKLAGWVRQKGPTVIGICCCGDLALVGKAKLKKKKKEKKKESNFNSQILIDYIREQSLFFLPLDCVSMPS